MLVGLEVGQHFQHGEILRMDLPRLGHLIGICGGMLPLFRPPDYIPACIKHQHILSGTPYHSTSISLRHSGDQFPPLGELATFGKAPYPQLAGRGSGHAIWLDAILG